MRFFPLTNALQASQIALGGNIFGYFCDEKETAALFDAAEECGINFVDTADVYSAGLSETFIGNALKTRRDRWIVASKIGLESGGDPRHCGRPENIRLKIEASLRRLQTDYIDLYQMHHFDPATPLEESLRCLEALRREGKIRAYGLSNFSGAALKAACDFAGCYAMPMPTGNQRHYNLIARAAEQDAFPVAARYGAPLLVYGVLARGILSAKYKTGDPLPKQSRALRSPSLRQDLTGDVIETVHQMAQCAENNGASLSQAAVAWSLRSQEVGAAIIGMRSPEQVRSIAHAADLTLPSPFISELETLARQIEAAHANGFGVAPLYG
ncbi:MAG: aldo/keto reductase [Alphaproteobacteria bacterium]|nr:aldo/keto reductase [Alphaproteobacteria bacterium]